MTRFRISSSRNRWWNVLKTIIQTIFFWGLFLWIIPWHIHQFDLSSGISTFDFRFRSETAWMVFVPASVLGLSSGLTMSYMGSGTPFPLDCCSELVVQGPYRFVRNPMAIAGLFQGAAVGLWYGSYLVLVYVVCGAFLWNYVVRPVEEADLRERIGSAYDRYCHDVKCWIPSMRFFKSETKNPACR